MTVAAYKPTFELFPAKSSPITINNGLKIYRISKLEKFNLIIRLPLTQKIREKLFKIWTLSETPMQDPRKYAKTKILGRTLAEIGVPENLPIIKATQKDKLSKFASLVLQSKVVEQSRWLGFEID